MSKKGSWTKEETLIYGLTALFVAVALLWYGLQERRWWAILIVVVLVLGIIAASAYFFFVMKKKITRKEHKVAKMSDIDKMNGVEFEDYLSVLFTKMGYKVNNTPHTDQGADLLIKKNEKKVAVQAKRYSTPVGNAAVQEVVAAQRYYKADEAWVVTNFERFTVKAIALAKKSDVKLIDRDTLARWNNRYL